MTQRIYSKDGTDYAFKEQAAWGTPETTDFLRLNCEPRSVDFGTNFRVANRSGTSGVTVPASTGVMADAKGSVPMFSIVGPARQNELDFWLYGVCQECAEDAGPTNFTRTISLPTGGQRDFPALAAISGAGKIFTFEKINPAGLQAHRLSDCIIRRLKLSGSDDGPGSRIMQEIDIVGRGPVEFNVASPTFATDIVEAYYYFHDISALTIAGVEVYPRSFELEILSGALPSSVDKSDTGRFYSWALAHTFTFKVSCQWEANAESVQDDINSQAGSDVPYTAVMEIGSSGSPGYLKMTAYCRNDQAPDNEAEVKTIDFSFSGVYDGTNDPLTFLHTTLTDRGWAA